MKEGLMISIEGIPCAGKSTIQKYLTQQYGGTAIAPLWDFDGGPHKYLGLPRTYEESRKREKQILKLNIKMLNKADESRKNGSFSYLHQSHTSSLAFSYAFSRYSNIDTLLECARDYFDSATNGVLKIPDIYVFLIIPFSEFLHRHKERRRFVNNIWSNEQFVKDYTLFYYNYTKDAEKSPTFYIDGQKSANQVSSEASRIVDAFASCKKAFLQISKEDAMRNLKDFIRKL